MSQTIFTETATFRGITCDPVEKHPFGYVSQRPGDDASPESQTNAAARAFDELASQVPTHGPGAHFRDFILGMSMPSNSRHVDYSAIQANLEKAMVLPNAIAKSFRDDTRSYQTTSRDGKPRNLPTPDEIAKSGVISKSVLDVGTSQNFANITGGQALGYLSLDTRVARGTVRPDSFTLYQALNKSAANQVVDYWSYIDDPGGVIPGAAFQGFTNVSSGTLSTNVGSYSLQSIFLKLALDGRAVTMALMAQNSFADIAVQENANAALSVLNSVNWTNYWGNSTLFTNQPVGLASSIPTANIFDFTQFQAANATLQGWTAAETLYNLIYEASANITSWGKFGRTTHAFMTPVCAGSLQGLVTNTLNNLLNLGGSAPPGIVVDGDLQGMRTRMGVIQFPLDQFITARDIPAQAQTRANGTSPATLTGPTPPVSVAVALSGATAVGSRWGVGAGSPFLASGTGYVSGTAAQYGYAVASTDAYSNESVLTFATGSYATVSGITATGAYVLTITPPAAADATTFRIFRTGLGGYAAASGSATAYRYVGSVAASGSSAVTWADLNTKIPGSETVFLLDMREEDFAIDYRYLLPLTRVELFAQNLYMPWAVTMIGAVRNRIPKFHGIITNILVTNPTWNPLGTNA